MRLVARPTTVIADERVAAHRAGVPEAGEPVRLGLPGLFDHPLDRRPATAQTDAHRPTLTAPDPVYARPMASLAKTFTSLHAGVYRATKGKVGGKFGAAKILLLTTTGRKSGQPRTTPLNYYSDGDRIVLIASNNGQDHDPAWYLNIVANPSVSIRARRGDGHARRARRHAGREGRAVAQDHRLVQGLRQVPGQDQPQHPAGDRRVGAGAAWRATR